MKLKEHSCTDIKVIYKYGKFITTDPEVMDNVIRRELSQKWQVIGDEKLADEWADNVESHPYSPEEMLDWVRRGYILEVTV